MHTTPYILPTYTRIVMSGWPAIFGLINKYTRVVLSKQQAEQADEEPIPLLSTEQIQEVFLDKQNMFIRYSIAVRAKMVIASTEIDKQLQQAKSQIANIAQVMHPLTKLPEENQDQEIIDALQILEDCLKDAQKIQNDLEKKLLFFDRLVDILDELTHKQDKEWEQFRHKWTKKLEKALEKAGIPLTELEKTEINRQKTMAELIDRMKELGMPLPEEINAIQI